MKYKVIVRDPESGKEEYIDDLTKTNAVMEASKQAGDKSKAVYIEWQDSRGNSGYMNRDGGTDCPGEPW